MMRSPLLPNSLKEMDENVLLRKGFEDSMPLFATFEEASVDLDHSDGEGTQGIQVPDVNSHIITTEIKEQIKTHQSPIIMTEIKQEKKIHQLPLINTQMGSLHQLNTTKNQSVFEPEIEKSPVPTEELGVTKLVALKSAVLNTEHNSSLLVESQPILNATLSLELADEEDFGNEANDFEKLARQVAVGTQVLIKSPTKLKKKKRKKAEDNPSKALDTLLTKGKVDKVFVDRAQMLTEDQVNELMKKPDIVEATLVLGISMNDVLLKPYECFTVEGDSVTNEVPEHIAQLRYDAHKKHRIHCIASLLQASKLASQKIIVDAIDKAHTCEMKQATLAKAVAKERMREHAFRLARTKLKQLRIQDDEELLRRRREFETREQERMIRNENIEAARRAQIQAMHDKLVEKQTKLDLAASRRKEKQLSVIEKVLHREDEIENRLHSSQSTAFQLKEQEKTRHQIEAMQREKVFKTFKLRQKNYLDSLRASLNEKQTFSNETAELQRVQREISLEKKALEESSRRDRVQRIQSAQSYRKTEKIQRVQNTYDRMEQMREIKEYLYGRRADVWKEEHHAMDTWREVHGMAQRYLTPGPGEYAPQKEALHGGRFGMHNPKSDIEWQIYRAQQLPGPGEYEPWKSMAECATGGSFSKNKVPTDIDVMTKQAAEIPGPGDYEVVSAAAFSTAGSTSCTFERHVQPTAIQREVQAKRDLPGPGEYEMTAIELGTKYDPRTMRAKYNRFFGVGGKK